MFRVFFSVSWSLFATINYPKPLKFKTETPTEKVVDIADGFTAIGCFTYGIGVTLILFALGITYSRVVFPIVFVVAFSLTIYLRFRHIDKNKSNQRKSA